MLPFSRTLSVSPKRSSPRVSLFLAPSSKHARKRVLRVLGLALGTILGILFGLKLISDSRAKGGRSELDTAARKRPQLAPFGGTDRDELDELLKGGTTTPKGQQEVVFVDPRPGYDPHPMRAEDERYLAYLPHSG